MKLSALTLLSLFSSIYGAPRRMVVLHNVGGFSFDMINITDDLCNNSEELLKTHPDALICLDSNTKLTPQMIENVPEDKLTYFMNPYLTGTYPGSGDLNPLRVVTELSKLKEDQLTLLIERTRGFLGVFLPELASRNGNKTIFKTAIPNLTAYAWADDAVNRAFLTALINLTSDALLVENATWFKQTMTTTALPFSAISKSAAKAFLGTEEFCADLHQMIDAGTPSDIVEKITVECIENNGDNFRNTQFGRNVRILSNEVISHGPDFHASAFRYMTADQIAAYQSKAGENASQDHICENLKIPSFGNMSKLRADCFAGYLKSLGETVFFNMTNFYGRLPEDILSALEGEEVAKIAAVSWPFFSTAQLQRAVEKDEVCKSLPDGALDHHGRGVKISNGCFHELSNRNKGMALYHCTLSEDILAAVTAEEFQEYTLNLNGFEYKGKDIFTKTMFSPNIASIVKSMSSKVDQEQHICHLFNNEHTELKKYHVINLHASQQCVDCFKENINLNELNNLTLHMRKMLDLPDMVEKAGDEVYKYDRKQFNAVAMAHSDVCASMTKEIFVEMSEETRNGLKPECVASLKFLGEVEGKIIKAMSPKSFSLLTSEQYNAIKDKLTAAQAKAVPVSAKAAPAEAVAEAAAPAEAAPPAK